MPDIDDLEVSVFGPGFGECLAVHLPGGKWVLVDSCRDSRRRPASLAYLREMGVRPESDVAMIIATHWHSDHIDGIAEMVGECRSAEPVMSLALHARELLAFTRATRYLGRGVPGAIVELKRLTEMVDAARPPRSITLSQARRKLLECKHGTFITTVDALSPSPASVQTAMSHLSRSRLEAGRELDAPQPDHNSAAIVIRVRSGNVSMLLGSDLEIQADPARGWRGVLDAWGDAAHRSEVIKIAHHGSANADAELIWTDLLAEMPIGILTHFHKGSVHLPSPNQAEFIAQRCSGLFSTSGHSWAPAVLTAETAAERLARGERLSPQTAGLGHVRARIKPGQESSWRLSVCGPAAVIPVPVIRGGAPAGVPA